MVFGEGRTGGIMFIGEGPGVNEEEAGRPFVGRSGIILRKTIHKLGLSNCSYISNVVACRSCGPKYDNQGKEMTRYDRRLGIHTPIIVDEPPPTLAVNTCLARLYEEIYLVDPLLIVALGAEAAKALMRRPVKVTEKRGTTMPIKVPGVWRNPDLTAAKKTWVRKQHGRLVLPTTQNYVEYLMLVTLHPAHVLRAHADRSHGNPLQSYVADMQKASDIYFRYAREAFGLDHQRRVIHPPESVLEE